MPVGASSSILSVNADLTAGGVFHDPEVFPKPDEFNPDRWLQDDMKSDRTYDLVFGTARVRVCLRRRFSVSNFYHSGSALGRTSPGIRLWVTLVIDRPYRIFTKSFTGDQRYEAHLGLQILQVQGPRDEAAQGLRSQRFRESKRLSRLSVIFRVR
jgi:hypothetical protein